MRVSVNRRQLAEWSMRFACSLGVIISTGVGVKADEPRPVIDHVTAFEIASAPLPDVVADGYGNGSKTLVDDEGNTVELFSWGAYEERVFGSLRAGRPLIQGSVADVPNVGTVSDWGDVGPSGEGLHDYELRRLLWYDVLLTAVTQPAAGDYPDCDQRRRSADFLFLKNSLDPELRGSETVADMLEVLEQFVPMFARTVDLRYVRNASRLATLKNGLKHFGSLRAGGTGLVTRARVPAAVKNLGNAATVVAAAGEVSEVVVAGVILSRNSSDRAILRAESLLWFAQEINADPAMVAAAKDVYRSVQAIRESPYRAYWEAFELHMDDLTRFGTETVLSRIVEHALAKSAASITVKGAAVKVSALAPPALIAGVAVFEAHRGLSDQTEDLRKACLNATLQRWIEDSRAQIASTQTPADPEMAWVLSDLGSIARYARADYYRLMKEAVGSPSWLDIIGKLVRYYSADQQELAKHMSDGFASASEDLADFEARVARAIGKETGCNGIPSIVLAIDSSGSMRRNDPSGLRIEAVNMIADLSPRGTVVSLLEFDDAAHVLVQRATNPEAVKRASMGIDSSGGTDIGSALALAGEESWNASTGRAGVLLFTDGKSSNRGSIEPFTKSKTPIYTVGLGADVDAGYLNRLAAETEGRFFHASSPGAIATLFDEVLANLTCEGTVVHKAGRIGNGQQREIAFQVDPALGSLAVRLTWDSGRRTLELTGPDGRIEPGVFRNESKYLFGEIMEPVPGRYVVKIGAEDVIGETGRFEFKAGGKSPVDIDISASPNSDGSFEASVVGESAAHEFYDVEAAFADSSTGGRIDAIVTRVAGGGWSIQPNVTQPGTYLARVQVNRRGKDGSVIWSRVTSQTVVIDQEGLAWIGRADQVTGAYVEMSRGLMHGIRPGMTVNFFRGDDPVGRGVVIAVERAGSTVEMLELTGTSMPRTGMIGQFDVEEWIGDQ